MLSEPFASAVRSAGLALIFAILLAVVPAGAQQRANVSVVGWFVFSAGEGGLDGFREGLREHGYVEGQNIAIEVRTPEESDDRLVEQIQDLAISGSWQRSGSTLASSIRQAFRPIAGRGTRSLRVRAGGLSPPSCSIAVSRRCLLLRAMSPVWPTPHPR